MKLKEIVAIGLVMMLSMPLVYIMMLFFTDNARIEFGPPSKTEKQKTDFKVLKISPERDSMLVRQSKAFYASEKERQEVEKERERLEEERRRLEIIRGELKDEREKLASERQRLEKLVEESDELDKKRIKQLARVYGAMRANEAATILETLDDDLVIKIINALGDDRQKGKIVSALSEQKARRITAKMGPLGR